MTPWILGALLLSGAIGRQQVSVFERSASAEIRRRLGGEDAQVNVRADVGIEALWGEVEAVRISGRSFTVRELPLYVEPGRSTAGWIHRTRVEMSNFILNGLRISSLNADIPDCNFDFAAARAHRELRVSATGEGTGEVIVRDVDLAAFALAKFKMLKSLTMTIRQDKVFIEGRAVTPIFSVDFWIVSSLEPIDGTKLSLKNARVMLNGKLSNGPQTNALLNGLNPIVDLNRDLNLHDAMTVKELSLRDGVLKARGGVRFATLVKEPTTH